jgi:hypothetical protein
MKLYATVTSERASKGQGGNDRLEIEVTTRNTVKGDQAVLAFITVLPSNTIVIDEGEHCHLVRNKYKDKGEQQKGKNDAELGADFLNSEYAKNIPEERKALYKKAWGIK